jgi:hypothetical protein
MWYSNNSKSNSSSLQKGAILSVFLFQALSTMGADVADAQASLPEEGMSRGEIISYAAMVVGFIFVMFLAWFTTDKNQLEEDQPAVRRPILRMSRRR